MRLPQRATWLALLAGLLTALSAAPARAEFLRATYLFDYNLEAQEPGAPALLGVDPLGNNRFEIAKIYNQQRPVYRWDGNAKPITEQAGLTLNTTGLIPPNNYSYEGILTPERVEELARDPFGNVVPEPASVTLLGFGVVAMLGYGRRKRAASLPR